MDSLVVVTGHINCHIKKSDYNGKFIKTEDRGCQRLGERIMESYFLKVKEFLFGMTKTFWG